MRDIRDHHGAMSSFRAAGNRPAKPGKGSFATQQKLIKELLTLVKNTADIAAQAKAAGLAERVTKEYAISDRLMRLDEEDYAHAQGLVTSGDALGVLCFIFATARQRQELSEAVVLA